MDLNTQCSPYGMVQNSKKSLKLYRHPTVQMPNLVPIMPMQDYSSPSYSQMTSNNQGQRFNFMGLNSMNKDPYRHVGFTSTDSFVENGGMD